MIFRSIVNRLAALWITAIIGAIIDLFSLAVERFPHKTRRDHCLAWSSLQWLHSVLARSLWQHRKVEGALAEAPGAGAPDLPARRNGGNLYAV